MTIDTTAPAHMLVQAEIVLSDQCCCSLPVEPTPVPGLAIIPTLRPDLDNLHMAYAAYTGVWAVLHLASGHTVTGGGLDSPVQAREQARLLGLLPIDWTAPADTVKNIDQQTKAAVCETWVTACLFNADSEDDEY